MLEISTSVIKNTVTFVVDKQSIAEAKNPQMTFNVIFLRLKTRRFVFRLKSNVELKRGNKWLMQNLLCLKRPVT